MFRPLSPFDMLQRVDVTVDDGVLASGYIGSWVEIYQNSEGYKVGAKNTQKARFASTTYSPVYVIWTEGNKRAAGTTMPWSAPTAGFTPDALYTKKVTTLFGKWRALTDMVETGTAKTPGTYLMPMTGSANRGKLQACTINTISLPGLYLHSGGIPCAKVRNYHSWLDHMGVTYSGVWEIESI